MGVYYVFVNLSGLLIIKCFKDLFLEKDNHIYIMKKQLNLYPLKRIVR